MNTQTEILENADRLFRKSGYKGVTMETLAKELGISKKTLYQHFENKIQIIEGVRSYSYARFRAKAEDANQKAQNAVESFLMESDLMSESYRTSNPAIFYELERFFPLAYQTFRDEILQSSIKTTKENLERGIKEGLYQADLNVDIAAAYRVESTLMVMRTNSLIHESSADAQTMNEVTTKVFLLGILTPAGLKAYQRYEAAKNK